MKHYNEHILTLYVLKAKEIARQRKAITTHLTQCAQCSAIVDDLRVIYADASQQLETKPLQKNVQSLVPAKRSTALHKRIEDLMYEPFRMPVPQRNAIQKAWFAANRYPVVTGSISFFALVFIALFTFQIVKNNYSPEKQNPVDFKIESNYSLALLNKFGERIGTIDINPRINAQILSDQQNYGEVRNIKFYDVDNDGINEVFLSESPVANSNGTANIHAYFLKHPERNWEYKINRELSFPNNPEFIIPIYGINEILIGDFDNDGQPELITNVKHAASFPVLLLKLDATIGKEIDWFYNPGSIIKLSFVDLDGDGIQEIIAVGANNSYKLPFIAIFDSRNIHGSAPSTTRYEASNVPLGTMKHYVLIPQTKIGKYYFDKTHLVGGAMRVSIYPESKKLRVQVADIVIKSDLYSTIEIVFNYDLKPLGVTTSTEFDNVALDLYEKKAIKSLPDKKYFQKYLQTLQYWNGKEFQTIPTLNSNYLEMMSKKEKLAHLP